MSQPVEVQEVLAELLAAWRAAAEELSAREQALVTELVAAIRLERRGAYVRALRKVRAMQATVDADMAVLVAETRLWIESDIARVYALAGTNAAALLGGTWVWTDTAVGAVRLLALETFDTVLAASVFTSVDTKRWIKEITGEAARLSATIGDTSTMAARSSARTLKVRGIGGVRYKDGSHRRIDDYVDMLLRTRIAEAYSSSSSVVYQAAGVQFVELTDGPGCGLYQHGGSPAADGLIVPLELHMAVPFAHPRCSRSAIPRPDLNGRSTAEAATQRSLRTPEQIEGQRSFREQLEQQGRTVSGRRRSRTSRRR